jgi:hypothetical protein
MDDYQQQLKYFHPIKAANLVAGLLLDPRFHANTFRIEALVHYILTNCSGTQRPSSKKVQAWLNDFPQISNAAYIEDPVEDVFVSKVLTDRGDFRIYQGIWEANDFCLQKVLDTIKPIPASFDLNSLFRPLQALLSLSEEVAKRNNADLYQIAESKDKTDIRVPSNEVLKRSAKSLCFTEMHIQNLGYELDDLGPFIFNPISRGKLTHKKFGNTDLERHPLLYDGNKIILALPTAVSIAIRRFVFEWLYKNGLVESFEKNFVGEYIELLQETPILGRPLPSGLPIHPQKVSEAYFFEAMAEIERGRYLQVIVRIDTLHGFFKEGMDTPAPHSQEQMEEVERRIQLAKKSFLAKDCYREGLSLVVFCGYGRPYFGSMSEDFSDWKIEFIPAHDFETLGWVPGASDKFVWMLIEQQRQVEQKDIKIMNINGVLNLYGWWEQTDYVLIPDEVEIGHGQWMIGVPTDCLAKVRQKTRAASNVHTEIYIDGTYKRVRRKQLSSFFQEDQNKPLYVSYEDRHEGILLGCGVTKTRPWWVSLNRDGAQLDFDTCYKIWDALHNWSERIGKVLDKKFPKLSIGPVLFSLDLAALPSYDRVLENPMPSSADLIDIHVDKNKNLVVLHLKEPFLYYMNNPVNISEKELVYACIRGFFDLAGLGLDGQEIKKLRDTIIPNQDARHIHFFKVHHFRDYMRSYDECEYKTIEEFDANFLKIGLGHIEGLTGVIEITGREECTSFLNKVVEHLWQQLKDELKKYNRASLITGALRNIEGIALEKGKWDRTARAVLSLHENENDVHKAKNKHFSSLYAADMASRIIVETAVCECPHRGGYEVGSLDISPLMARASLLFHMGSLSDAIKKGVTEPKIVVSGNGDIKSEHTFYDEIIMPFSSQFEKTKFTDAADKYETHFEDMPAPKSPSDVFHSDFLTAFEKEIGIAFEALRNFQETMENMALEKEEFVFTASQSEILNYCAKSELSSKDEALMALKGFCLFSRVNWEKPPSGYISRDINPWLFRRRLSLLFKPYVKIDQCEDSTYIISPGISSQALAYTLDTYWRGNIEEERCHSKEMKIWIGKERTRRGHEFNKEVASMLESMEYHAKPDVKVSSIVPKKNLDRNYGDVDVLAWREGEESIYAIECKNLYFAKTAKEIAEQLLEFKGKIRNGKPDRLKKHMDRVAILSKYKADLLKFCGVSNIDIRISSYVLFSNPVPMLYDSSTPKGVKLASIQEVIENKTLT